MKPLTNIYAVEAPASMQGWCKEEEVKDAVRFLQGLLYEYIHDPIKVQVLINKYESMSDRPPHFLNYLVEIAFPIFVQKDEVKE